MMECIESNLGDTPCAGPVGEYVSRSGATRSHRCDKHQAEYTARMNDVEDGLNRRYPGWQNPGSVPPAWFDEANAGERWDDDY